MREPKTPSARAILRHERRRHARISLDASAARGEPGAERSRGGHRDGWHERGDDEGGGRRDGTGPTDARTTHGATGALTRGVGATGAGRTDGWAPGGGAGDARATGGDPTDAGQ